MPIVIDAVGTVQAIASIQIKPRIDSQIIAVDVEEGARVKEGDILFELDARALKAQLAQVEAQIDKDRAQVEQAQARLGARRGTAGQGAGTEVDARHGRDHGQGRRGAARGRRGASGNVATPLSYTEIRAPVSGRIGSIPLKVGTMVRVGDNARPGARDRQPGRSDLRALRRAAESSCRAPRGAWPRARSGHRLVGDDRTQSGIVAFVENTVDPRDRHGAGQGEMANADEGLWPGPSSAEVVLGIEPEAIAVPAPAVQIGQQGLTCSSSRTGTPSFVRSTVERTAGRRIGDRQGPAGRRAGRGRRPAPAGRRRHRDDQAGDAESRPPPSAPPRG